MRIGKTLLRFGEEPFRFAGKLADKDLGDDWKRGSENDKITKEIKQG